jgi:hypothetical protein
MTDDDARASSPSGSSGSSSSSGTDPLASFLSQLRGMADQFGNLGKLADAIPLTSALKSMPGLGQLPPMPGAVTAAQIAAIATAVSAQRQSIQAMQAQLSAFDAQLGVLESILGPLSQWGSAWADVERRFTPGSSSDRPGQEPEPPTSG